MITETLFYLSLKITKELFYDKYGFKLAELNVHPESQEYDACSFKLNRKTIEYRTSKITPTKTGQFVTLWKRNKEGITEPFDVSDDFDFMTITSKTEDRIGQFVFPKKLLAEKGIISQNGKGGKRGIRVYPPWDKVTNKQAEKTQNWQVKYFSEFRSVDSAELSRAKQILEKPES